MLTSEGHSRSKLMQLLRLSPGPMFLLFVAGACITGYTAAAPGRNEMLGVVGPSMLILSGVLFCTVLWSGVYLHVVEASRGLPGLRTVERPDIQEADPAAKLELLEAALTRLGFYPAGWFSLDDFDMTHVGAWKHDHHHAGAFVLYSPNGRSFKVRFIRQFPDGGILVTSSRMNDLAIAPPQGMYVQTDRRASVELLWARHLEAESHFPQRLLPSEAHPQPPRDLFIEVYARWSKHIRRDRTWLLAVEPVEECWRMYWLTGMPLQVQFERGWATPYWR